MVTQLTRHQDGVASLAQLYDLGITYDEIRAELSAGRWHRLGRRTLSTVGPEPSRHAARWRRALWEVGGGASLDGTTALLAWGLTGWREPLVHVSVPPGVRYRKVDGVRVHVLRQRGRVVTGGVPRTAPESAALRAAMWARSDREAATVMSMAVQQGKVPAARLMALWRSTSRCPRRAFLEQILPLVCDGAQALSEIDFAMLGRARGWPEPDRQAVVTTTAGRVYLDVRFAAYGVLAEINGVQHYQGLAPVEDALRRNDHAIGSDTALEIPAVGLVLSPRPFLDQVEAALRKGGWRGPTPPV